MQRKQLLLTLLLLLVSGLGAEGATTTNTFTVKAGGGGNFTTIQACATAMAAGDTCTVFAGTYNEVVTLSAGTVGNYKTMNVNTGDTVNVFGFVMASHTKITGFTITRPASPGANLCVSIPTGITDAFVTGNTMTQCGAGQYMVQSPQTTTGASFIRIQNNIFSFGCFNPGGSDACKVIMADGDHWLIENNDATRTADFVTLFANHTVMRGNKFHDIVAADCVAGSHGSNCHIDMIESEPESTTPGSQFNLIEGNTELRNFGPQAHSFLTQGDACGGRCGYMIERFNVTARQSLLTGGSYGILDDLAGYPFVKNYNNTDAFVGSANDATDTFGSSSTNGAEKNNIFYYNGSIKLNPYAVVGGAGAGWSSGHNLAFCTLLCTFFASNYSSGAWTDDPGNKQADPQFVNSASDDYHLGSGSPAIGAGSYLTTASGSGTNSASLTVGDASYFFDGAGGLVNPDWIRIGSSTTVQISSINYSTNTITLTSPVSWSSGDGVYLYKDSKGNVVLTGANPDLGAFPTGVAQAAPPPPTNLQATVN
jgi:hypothetical protein